MQKQIAWSNGGYITLTYDNSEGNQTISVSSDANTGEARSKTITVKAGDATKTLTINQAAYVKQTGSVTLYPSAADTVNYSYASVNSSYPLTRPVGYGSTSTRYSQWNLKTGSRAESYVFYKFDCSGIPANATITKITCTAKGYINQTNSNRINTRQMQMYYGTSTAKGTAVTVSNSATAQTISCGSWTRSELNDIRIRCYAKRGTSSTTTSYYMRFYGATLTIEYEY